MAKGKARKKHHLGLGIGIANRNNGHRSHATGPNTGPDYMDAFDIYATGRSNS
jgi:hypothetical protein